MTAIYARMISVLTDYHVHLRPDERPSEPADYFTVDNVDEYKHAAAARGVTEFGASEHIHRFTAALDVWQHPFWTYSATDDLDEYCDFIKQQDGVKLGIECDYIGGREDQLANLLDARSWDYVIGSVHFVGDHGIDAAYTETGTNWDVWHYQQRADRVWSTYFDALARAAASGLYDIMAHPDLVKVWGRAKPAPDRDPRFFYEPAIQAIAESGVAVEVSTAGLRKPVGEIYPSLAFLEMVADAGNPVVISSDAHCPEHVGFAYANALRLLDQCGIKHLATFEGRQRSLVAITDAARAAAHEMPATWAPTVSGDGRP